MTTGNHTTQGGGGGSPAGRPLSPGTVVGGRYEVVRFIGRGGMGAVYEAEDLQAPDTPGAVRRFALKTILPEHVSNAKARERFLREIHAARSLRHPGIVAVYDVQDSSDSLFFTMELLEGAPLRVLMRERKQFELGETVSILRRVCQAVAYAHRTMVHRDISPENVFVLPNGDVKLLDFGLARVHGRTAMTGTGVALGKAHYAAPEQRRDASRVDSRADIYALGVLFYEMLTGTLPYGARRAGELRPDLPPACDELLGKTLVSVENRIATVGEFVQGLERCVQGTQPPAEPVPQTPPPPVTALPAEKPAKRRFFARRIPSWVALSTLVVVATATGAGLLRIWGQSFPDEDQGPDSGPQPASGPIRDSSGLPDTNGGEPAPDATATSSDGVLEGTWTGWAGSRVRNDRPRDWRVTFENDRFVIDGPDEHYEGNYTVNTSTNPMELDLNMTSFSFNGVTQSARGVSSLAIIRQSANTTTFAVNVPGSPARPTSFDGSGSPRVFTCIREE